MDKDINCINFKGLFGYIENQFGQEVLVKLVEDAVNSKTYVIPNKNRPGVLEPVTLEHLVDESYWISNELSLSLLSMIKTVVPGLSRPLKSNAFSRVMTIAKLRLTGRSQVFLNGCTPPF